MPQQTDLASSCTRTVLFWGPGIVLIAATANFGSWPRTIGWTAGLLWLAAFCLWNVARCGRVHCIFTGPFFLIMAAVTLLAGFGILPFGAQTWNVLCDAIVIGGLVLWLVPELVWGPYWRSRSVSP